MKIPKKYKDKIKNKIKAKQKKKRELSEAKNEEVKQPSAAKKLKNFAVSAIKHAVNGMPTCTQEEINERLAVCQGCKWFRGQKCYKCGCACNNNKKFLNKLAWADQECPIGKWGKIEKEEE
tara:strand:- start:249 stop:611 length:363 start_codon:yes stop_codon:yes gene_type:complete